MSNNIYKPLSPYQVTNEFDNSGLHKLGGTINNNNNKQNDANNLISGGKKRMSKKRMSKKRISKKRMNKKRMSKKLISKKRISKKRISKKRISKKRISKKKGGTSRILLSPSHIHTANGSLNNNVQENLTKLHAHATFSALGDTNIGNQ